MKLKTAYNHNHLSAGTTHNSKSGDHELIRILYTPGNFGICVTEITR